MKFILGFIIAFLLIALGLGTLWGLDRFGIINSKNLILQAVSYYPGLKDLGVSYELGQKQSLVLEERVRELQNADQKIKMEQAKINQERAAFDAAKLNWEKQHLLTASGTQAAGTQAAQKPGASPSPQPLPKQLNPMTKEEESKLKAYLATIGSLKPEIAAQVIQKLPENITFLVFEQTPDRKITKIMEYLPPDYVAVLTRDRVNKYR